MVLIFACINFRAQENIFFARINFRASWKSLLFACIKFRASSNFYLFFHLFTFAYKNYRFAGPRVFIQQNINNMDGSIIVIE